MDWHKIPGRGGAATVVLLSGFLGGCGTSGKKAAPVAAPPVVTVAPPIVRDFTPFAEYTGRVEAVDNLELRARVGGFLKEIHVQDGDIVKSGQLLLTIDPAPFEAVLQARVAGVEKAKTALKLAEANIARSGPLVKSGAIPPQEFDVLVAQGAQAAAEVMAADAALQSARLDVSYTRITAPFDGRMSDVKVSVGAPVAGGTTGNGTLLANVVSFQPVSVSFDLDEATLLRTRRPVTDGVPKVARELNVPVKVALGNSADFNIEGVIDYVDPSVNPGTGTLKVRAQFPNTDRTLMPGLFVRVRLALGTRPNTLLVPVRALGQNQNQNYVYILDEKKAAQYRPISVGAEQDGLVVVEKGLAPTDTVVIDGTLRVRPGVQADPKPADLSSFGVPTTGTKIQG
jgi:RND family efflux transporter MFP subunit